MSTKVEAFVDRAARSILKTGRPVPVGGVEWVARGAGGEGLTADEFGQALAALSERGFRVVEGDLVPAGCCVTGCPEPVACFGAYEGNETKEYSCDIHCAHGCEDGRCEPIKEGAPWET